MDAELERVLASHRRAIEDKNAELAALRSRLTEAEGLLRDRLLPIVAAVAGWDLFGEHGNLVNAARYAEEHARAFLAPRPTSTPPPAPLASALEDDEEMHAECCRVY